MKERVEGWGGDGLYSGWISVGVLSLCRHGLNTNLASPLHINESP